MAALDSVAKVGVSRVNGQGVGEREAAVRIAFVDVMGHDYTMDTPYEAPLGGMPSAGCYLAVELARLGHAVTYVNDGASTATSRGVRMQPAGGPGGVGLGPETLAGFDAAVLVGFCPPDLARRLQAAERRPFLVYWTGHADNQPAVAPLKDPDYAAVWDALVFVSQWQADRFAAAFPLPDGRSVVLRNAVAPAFAAAEGVPPLSARLDPPVLAYTSTPFRGLDVLLAAFPRIRAALPGARLKVFSSMAVYQMVGADDAYGTLYATCRATEGVEYVGSLPQPELARAMRDVTLLAYPNTWSETSCIAVMEALAAGCLVATSDLGALPETLAGFGAALPVPADPQQHAAQFAELVGWLLGLARQKPEVFDARQREQIAHVRAELTWTVRAREWSDWLTARVAS